MIDFLSIFNNFSEHSTNQTGLDLYDYTLKTFISLCTRKFKLFSKDHRQIANFIVTGLVFLIKKSDDKDVSQSFLLDLEKFLENDNLKFIERDLMGFESFLIQLLDEKMFLQLKKKLLKSRGLHFDVVKICFKEEEFEECMNTCIQNKTDPDLPVFYL